MIVLAHCYFVMSFRVVSRQESGENLAIFCYLILWGAFAMLWCRLAAPILNSARADRACSNQSFTFSALSIVPKGLEN